MSHAWRLVHLLKRELVLSIKGLLSSKLASFANLTEVTTLRIHNAFQFVEIGQELNQW